ncbi:MAG TPA: hypothetical protein DEB39_09140 [Planctomycetaceae bacterium]|nr:hypothetical protein [Planctomycetaceae bacterium]
MKRVAFLFILFVPIASLPLGGFTQTPAESEKHAAPSDATPARDALVKRPERLPQGVLPVPEGGGLLFYAPLDERSDREDGNAWPDGWARKTGMDQGIRFPAYVEVAIRENATPFGLRSLHFAVAGGGVAVYSPRIPIRFGMSYTANIYVNISGLKYNRVFMNISLFNNKSARPLKMVASPVLLNTGGWRELEIDRITADSPDADYAVIGLILLPGARADLEGSVDFVNLRLRESPTVTLSTINRNHVFTDNDGIDVECRLIGIPSTLKAITFVLEDTFGRPLERRTVELKSAVSATDMKPMPGKTVASDTVPNMMSTALPGDTRKPSAEKRGNKVSHAHASWPSLPIVDPGFYRVRVESYKSDGYESANDVLPEPVEFSAPIARLPSGKRAPRTSAAENFNGFSYPVPSVDVVRKNIPVLYRHSAEGINVPNDLPFPGTGRFPESFDPTADVKPLTLVYIEPSVSPVGGEFGWTMHGFTPEMLDAIKTILGQAGISQIKLPTWLPLQTTEKEWERMQEICTWLARRRIRIIGLLDAPPKELVDKIKFGEPNVAAVFTLPVEDWSPTIRQMLMKISLLVKDWQLGADNDPSMREISGLRERFAEIRTMFNTVGYDVGLGFAWDWSYPIPPSFRDDLPPDEVGIANAPITPPPIEASLVSPFEQMPPRPPTLLDSREFLALSSEVPLSPEELAYQLRQTEGTNPDRHISIEPLSKKDFTTQDRVIDLVQRMLVGKINRADGVFLQKPYDDQSGLMNADGTPGELFLPWRTTALLLCGRRYAGSIRMPGNSTNVIFEDSDGNGLMVLWNEAATLEKPVEEVLFLGRNTEIITLDGRREPMPLIGREQAIPVGPVPMFVAGIDMDITRWRQRFVLEKKVIPSYTNRKNANSWTFENASKAGIAAELTLMPPDPESWQITPDKKSFVLQAGDSEKTPFTISISPKATSGPHPFHIRVRTEGATSDEFTIYDEIAVGADDVAIEFMTRLNRNGELEVYQTFTNNTGREVNYACSLYATGEPVVNHQVRKLSFGQDLHEYTFKNGAKLIGTMLRVDAKPFAGSPGQPLRYHFRATTP